MLPSMLAWNFISISHILSLKIITTNKCLVLCFYDMIILNFIHTVLYPSDS